MACPLGELAVAVTTVFFSLTRPAPRIEFAMIVCWPARVLCWPRLPSARSPRSESVQQRKWQGAASGPL